MHTDSIVKVISGALKGTINTYPDAVTFATSDAKSRFITLLAGELEGRLTDGLKKRIAEQTEERLLNATDMYKLLEEYKEKNEKLQRSNRYLLEKLNQTV